MSGANPWLVVVADGAEHFIAWAQVVEVVFRSVPAGGSVPAGEGDDALSDRTRPEFWMIHGGLEGADDPSPLVARIVTAAAEGGQVHTVEVTGDGARELYRELRRQAGLPGDGLAVG